MRRKIIGQLLKLVPKKKKKRIMIGYLVPLKEKLMVANRGRLGKNKNSL